MRRDKKVERRSNFSSLTIVNLRVALRASTKSVFRTGAHVEETTLSHREANNLYLAPHRVELAASRTLEMAAFNTIT